MRIPVWQVLGVVVGALAIGGSIDRAVTYVPSADTAFNHAKTILLLGTITGGIAVLVLVIISRFLRK